MAEHPGKAPNPLEQRTDAACTAFEDEWRAGRRPRIEDFAYRFPVEERDHVCKELIEVEIWHRRRLGEAPHSGEYWDRFPELRNQLQSILPSAPELADSAQSADPLATTLNATSASEGVGLRLGSHLGDYEILRELGRGGMGVVYQARHRMM